MRDILISIQPQWNEKILNGEKTIEIDKQYFDIANERIEESKNEKE